MPKTTKLNNENQIMGGDNTKVGNDLDPWNRNGIPWVTWNEFKSKNPEASDDELVIMIQDTRNWWKNFDKNH